MKSVVYNGKEYKSLKELAKEYGINYSTFCHRIGRLGYSIDEALKLEDKRKAKRVNEIEVFGKKYANLKQLADDFGIDYKMFLYRINVVGLSIEKAIELGNGRKSHIEVFGKKYNSLREVAKEFGVSYQSLYYRKKNGLPIEDLISGAENSIDVFGRKFKTLKDVAKAYGINYSTLCTRLRKGMSVEEAITKPINRR